MPRVHGEKLQAKYLRMAEEIVASEEFLLDDAEIGFVAYGICARICKSSARILRKKGIRAGVLRPKTLFPFPSAALRSLAGRMERMVTVELSSGHMHEDVRLALGECVPVSLYRWSGGVVPRRRRLPIVRNTKFDNHRLHAHYQTREAKDILRPV